MEVGRFFGPVMALWFILLAVTGIKCSELSPSYAIVFVGHADGWTAFTVLGSVFLALTGGEALYADMGHFGRTPSGSTLIFVMPALVLNYFGQGALVLSSPDALADPFFLMFPASGLIPAVVLTTAAP